MTDSNITKDAMYGAVAPDDFESMIELDRYEQRSTAFDKIISATHDHFWDPLDKKYIDFDRGRRFASSTTCSCGISRRSCMASRAR